jgi:hypothetical protein
MFAVPESMVAVIAPLAPVFLQHRVWLNAQILLWGTILGQGRRTVASALRAVGLGRDTHFTTFHRILNRDVWSRMLASSRILLGMLLARFVSTEATIVVAIDDFIERRHSKRLFGVGTYRDPVASSRGQAVPCRGLRWLVASVCVSIPGASRVWALPVPSHLCHPPEVKTRRSRNAPAKGSKPARRARLRRRGLRSRRLSTAERPFVKTAASKRAQRPEAPRRHKTTIDVAAQVVSVLRRWLPGRRIVAVLDGAYLSYKLLRHALRMGVGLVVRASWTMVIFEPPVSSPGRGPAASRGRRIGSLRQIGADPATAWSTIEIDWYGAQRKRFSVATGTGVWSHDRQTAIPVRWVISRDLESDSRKRLREEVFVTTDLEASASQILEWYVMRWSEEVTFEESRRHLGIETQQQFSPTALKRETPGVLGLFSIVTLLAVETRGGSVPVQQAAWYAKTEVTFSDCLASVRRQLWRARYLQASGRQAPDGVFRAADLELLLDALPLSA